MEALFSHVNFVDLMSPYLGYIDLLSLRKALSPRIKLRIPTFQSILERRLTESSIIHESFLLYCILHPLGQSGYIDSDVRIDFAQVCYDGSRLTIYQPRALLARRLRFPRLIKEVRKNLEGVLSQAQEYVDRGIRITYTQKQIAYLRKRGYRVPSNKKR